MSKSYISNGSPVQRIGLRDLTSALVVTGGVLLIVDHWRHFDTADLILLGLVFIATAADLLIWLAANTAERRKSLPLNDARTAGNSADEFPGSGR